MVSLRAPAFFPSLSRGSIALVYLGPVGRRGPRFREEEKKRPLTSFDFDFLYGPPKILMRVYSGNKCVFRAHEKAFSLSVECHVSIADVGFDFIDESGPGAQTSCFIVNESDSL